MKTKKVTYKIPLYYGELVILQGKNNKSFPKKYDLSGTKGYAACTFKDHKKDGSTRYVVIFFGKTDISTIAHEALHVVNQIFDDRLIYPDLKNDEPQAYLIGWVVSKCYNFLEVK
jgi:hypothetical protein